MKLTKWIPGNVKPVRVGVYERPTYAKPTRTLYSYWNGLFWGTSGFTPKQAARWRETRSVEQTLPWRGLAEKPE